LAQTAEDTNAAAQDAAAQTVYREQIVVTATRFSTSLQRTPISMDALSSDTLQQAGVKNFSDFELMVPSLSAEDLGPGNKRYAIRNIQAAGEPEVGLYYDEIPIAGLAGENNDTGNQMPDLNLFDVERIEVLKGPQGTLYGEGSMGGTIRVISKRPNLTDYEAEAQADFAGVEHGDVNKDGDGMLNFPLISDRLALRVVAYYHDDPGYIREIRLGLNDANTVISTGGRASLRAKLSDDWTVDLIAYNDNTHEANTPQQMPAFGNWMAADFTRTPHEDRFQGYNLVSVTQFPFASLTVLGSYQERTVIQELDLTPSTIAITGGNNPATGLPLCNVLNYVACLNANAPFALALLPVGDINTVFDRAWSGEVRLQSPETSKMKWTVGGFFQKRQDYNQTLVGGPTNADGSVSINQTTGLAQNTLFARQNWDPLQQEAVFGEVTYPISTTLDATAGWRFSHGQRSDSFDQIQNFTEPPFNPGDTGFFPRTTYHQNSNTPKAELAYHPDDNQLYYVLAAKGFRLGGPNVPNAFNATQITIPTFYNADELWDYELGSKTMFLNKRVTVDGSLFWMNWTNIQETQTDPTGVFQFIGNGGHAVAKGAELELDANATEHFELNGGISYTHAALTGVQPAQVQVANTLRSGDGFPFVPNWTADMSGTYRIPFASHTLWARGDMFYRSGQTTAFDMASPIFTRLPGYWLANFRVGVDIDDYSAQLYITNIADRRTDIGGVPQADELLQVVSTPPRTVGILLKAKFW